MLHSAQAELAHVTRLTTLGELTASIAHEVNQPLAAVVANAEACLGWLDRENPDLNAARRSAEWVIDDGIRASEVVRRVRALANKTDTERVPLDVNDVVREAVDAGTARVGQPPDLVADGIGTGSAQGSLVIGSNCSR